MSPHEKKLRREMRLLSKAICKSQDRDQSPEQRQAELDMLRKIKAELRRLD